MDEIEYKLSSNNKILISHAVSKLLETIKDKKRKNPTVDVLKIDELKLLLNKCKNDDINVCSISCQGLLFLIDANYLDVSFVLSKLIGYLGESKNDHSLTSTICDLLSMDLKKNNSISQEYKCQYSIITPQHPFITILKQYQNSWRNILDSMKTIINRNYLNNRIELLRPVFFYIIGDPNLSLAECFHQQSWSLLIKTPATLELQIEILQWQLIHDDINLLVNFSNMILELTEFALINRKNDTKICTILSTLNATSAYLLLKHNHDPKKHIIMIESLLNDDLIQHFAGNILLGILSELVLISLPSYLPDIINITELIIKKVHCSSILAYGFITTLLSWMAYANLLTFDAVETANNLIKMIKQQSFASKAPEVFYSNKFFCSLYNTHQVLQFYSEICSTIDDWSDETIILWLDRLVKLPESILYQYRIILFGLLLQSCNSTVVEKCGKILIKVTKKYKNIAGYVLSLILHKLSNNYSIHETKELLFLLPELAIAKENVPLIIQILDTFINYDGPLKYFGIELYLKAWTVEPRCHKNLFSALIYMMKNDKTFKGTVTCAKVIKYVCETRPEHGAELVPFLSQLLNQCSDTIGSTSSALVLNSISQLCLSGVIDVCSTWQVIAPKINKETRTVVLKNLCQFFGDIPSCPPHNEEEFDKLLNQVLTKLWEFTDYETTLNVEIIESAFKALSAYQITQLNLSILPERLKSSIELPKKYAQSLADSDKKLEDVLLYIPGNCWITLLETTYEPAIQHAVDLIIKFVTDELYGFKTGIYIWSIGEPINFKYLPEKSLCRAIGEYLRRYKSDSNDKIKKICQQCLKIFSHKYPKALPPIQWKFFNDAINSSEQCWIYGLTLACHQVGVSPTAKEFITNYLNKMIKLYTKSQMTREEFEKSWQLCLNLEDICLGVSSLILKLFLESTINYIFNEIHSGNDDAVDRFRILMESFGKALRNDHVHHDNKTMIGDVLKNLLDRVDIHSNCFPSFVGALLEMSAEVVAQVTLPSTWRKVTEEKLEKAIVIRSNLVLKKSNEVPMSWMDDMIHTSVNFPKVHKCLFSNIKRIQYELRQDKSNATWIWDLMCQIQVKLIDSEENNLINNNDVTFLCDVLFVSLIFISCGDCLLADDELIISSHDVRARLFPYAMNQITKIVYWNDMIQQIMEWLNLLRINKNLPESYKMIFYNGLIVLKNQKCYKDTWTKYFSTSSFVNLSKSI